MFPYLEMFYTQNGFLPLSEAISSVFQPWSWSLFAINDQPWFVFTLFGVYALLLCFFILGYKTRRVNFFLWIFVVSMHNRNGMGLNGGDELIRSCLLILSFLPLGAKYSIDHALSKRKNLETHTSSFWVFALFVQLGLMYFCSALFKSSPIWTNDYTALSYAIYLDAFTKNFADYLKSFPELLKLLSFLVIHIEKYLPFVFFLGIFPKLRTPTRFIVIGGFIGFHFGIHLIMNVGNFAFYVISLWLAFLPSVFWERITYKKYSLLNVYYDGECGFCGKLTRILLIVLGSKEIHLLQAQSSNEIYDMMIENNSWVIRDRDGNTYFGFNAFIEVLQRSHFQFLCPLLRKKIFKNTGEFFYKFVAQNRFFFSHLTSFLNYNQSEKIKNSIIKELLAIPLIIIMTYWCLNSLQLAPFNKYNRSLSKANQWLHTYQSWNIFAPFPKNTNIWFQFRGILSNNIKVNLMLPTFTFYDPRITPYQIRERFYNKSIRKTFMRMESDQKMRERLAKYYCKEWRRRNIAQKLRLDKVEIFMGKEHIYKPHKLKPYGMELIHSKFCE